jgi:hypothetical protein
LIYEELKKPEPPFNAQRYHRILEEKYPQVGVSPQQLTQFGVKLIGDQAACILKDGNNKLDLLIGYVQNIDATLSTLSTYIIQGKKKNVRAALRLLNNSTDTTVAQQFQTTSIDGDGDDDDEEEEEEEEEEEVIDELQDEEYEKEEVKQRDRENTNSNIVTSSINQSIVEDVMANKRKRDQANLKQASIAALRSKGKKRQTLR